MLIGLQVLRGFAALAVVAHHSLGELAPLMGGTSIQMAVSRIGACGVDIFFVLSGFIIHYTFGRSKSFGWSRAIGFAIKRMQRIVPLYWFFNIAMLLLWSTGVFFKNRAVDTPAILSSFLFLPSKDLLIPVAWTLSHEALFYLAFTLAIIRGGVVYVMTGLLVCAVVLVSILLPWKYSEFFSNPISFEFIFGLIISEIYQRYPHFIKLSAKKAYLTIALSLGLMWLFVLTLTGSDAGIDSAWRFLGWGLPSVGIVVAFLNIDWPRGRLATLGDASYALYLCHFFVVMGLGFIIKRVNFSEGFVFPLLVMSCLFSCILSLIVHYFFEKPMLNYFHRVRKSNQVLV